LEATFDRYAAYYDLLYADKPYGAEAEFVCELIRSVQPNAHTILELGCGTGLHALELARRGFEVCGVDLSEPMVAAAQARALAAPASAVTFEVDDLRRLRLGRKFDAVASLFHVISYQTTNSNLTDAFATAANHLNPDGVFAFDFWYGPAVLTEGPSVRTKRMENERVSVLRLAEPVLDSGRNVVDVNYSIQISDKADGGVSTVEECHSMRYLFLPEVEGMLGAAGLRIVRSCEWLSGKPLSTATWGATVVAVLR
jgi:SAM-dependent methyltransferase